MKILVVSDSHGNIDCLKSAVNSGNYDKIIHLGDGIKDILSLDIDREKLILVKGNIDYTDIVPTERIVEFEGVRFFLTHGDAYGVKLGLNKLIQRTTALEADVVLYGHTHFESQIKLGNGLICINPGSVGKGRLKQNTFAVLEIDASIDLFDCMVCEVV